MIGQMIFLSFIIQLFVHRMTETMTKSDAKSAVARLVMAQDVLMMKH